MCAAKEIQRIHPYTAATITSVEAWLSEMSVGGWKLRSVKGWRFSFVRCQPAARRYFMYPGFDASRGFFDEYSHARRKYALGSAALERSASIFEVDPRKADRELEACYSRRSRFYRRKYGGVALLLLAFELISCILAYAWGSWIPACILVLPTAYFLSMFLLCVKKGRSAAENRTASNRGEKK